MLLHVLNRLGTNSFVYAHCFIITHVFKVNPRLSFFILRFSLFILRFLEFLLRFSMVSHFTFGIYPSVNSSFHITPFTWIMFSHVLNWLHIMALTHLVWFTLLWFVKVNTRFSIFHVFPCLLTSLWASAQVWVSLFTHCHSHRLCFRMCWIDWAPIHLCWHMSSPSPMCSKWTRVCHFLS